MDKESKVALWAWFALGIAAVIAAIIGEFVLDHSVLSGIQELAADERVAARYS